MPKKISSIGASLGQLWCQTVHSEPMWPVKGEYKCRRCQRSFKVPWEQKTGKIAVPPASETAVVSTAAQTA